MAAVDPATLLLQLGVLLATAFLLGRLAERIGLPATTGELATGLVLGPSLLGSVAASRGLAWPFSPGSGTEFLLGLAAFSGALLIGVAGATIDFGFVRERVRTVLFTSLGALGVPLLSTLVVALAADPFVRGPAAGTWTFAAFAGLALSVSAVPVIVKIFADLGVLHRDLSQLSLSVAVIDDAAVWLGLSAVAATVHLHHASQSSGRSAHIMTALAASVALVVLMVVARRAIGAAEAPASRRDQRVGASCLVAAAVITLGAVITDGIGLDATLGAFVCGAIVGSGWLVPVASLKPLRTVVLGVLAPLFLAVSGLTADLRVLQDPRVAITALIVVVLAISTKLLGSYGGGRLAGLGHDAAMAVASALNARGTVQLVVAAAGLRMGLITVEGFTILVLVALVTSGMAGPMIRHHMRSIPETPSEDDRRRVE